ncbi:hypothetical protein [Streptomyces sp. WMMB303]|uniref:hypothetical protein n=1 Tax=Streptomyces sp. WMMB303 TaxID=3034154 RepID=UPI0023EDC84F|nr:hypothetical protein [Streptomyces sp. WMMB303]MDF4254668.1 hypothetical protein [Streptomyces sp. WMMB303]MDF4254705.1 hypothetical protein [Streptomyces sp. WMMB303]
MAGHPEQTGATAGDGRRPVHFPPVLNGLDYLESAVTHLAGTEDSEPDPRSLKYATLHLQAAAETLLKARLAIADKQLVWSNPERFDSRKDREGDFHSVKLETAVKLLREHCTPGTDLESATSAFTTLGRMRNRFQHLGVTDSDTMALEALSIPVLDTLLDFVADDLLPHVPREDWPAADTALEHVRAGMAPIQALVERRLAPLRTALESHSGSTVACLSCGQFTVMLDGSDTVVCALCRRGYGTPEEAAWDYAGTDEYTAVTGGGYGPVHMCEWCGATAALAVPVASGPEEAVLICFADGTVFDGVCDHCGQAVHYALHEAELCETCRDNAYARF